MARSRPPDDTNIPPTGTLTCPIHGYLGYGPVCAVVGAEGVGTWLPYSSQHATARQDAYEAHGIVVLLPKHADAPNPDGIRVRITAR